MRHPLRTWRSSQASGRASQASCRPKQRLVTHLSTTRQPGAVMMTIAIAAEGIARPIVPCNRLLIWMVFNIQAGRCSKTGKPQLRQPEGV